MAEVKQITEAKLARQVEVEAGILNAILNAPEVMQEVKTCQLKEMDFTQLRHRIIYKTMLSMDANGQAIDMTLLAGNLRENGEHERAGGAAYIHRLVFDVLPSSCVSHHCKMLKDATHQREIALLGDQFLKSVTSQVSIEQMRTEAAQINQAIREKLDDLDPDKASRSYLTGAEVLEREYDENPLIHGLLDRRESLVIVAPSGIGKSVLTNHMGFAGGNPPPGGLFGQYPIPRPYHSLFVQSENTGKAQNRRLSLMCKADPALRKGLGYMHFPFVSGDIRQTGILTDPNFEALLLHDLATTGADVLILDPLISFHGEDENDNGAMRRSLDRLTAICDKADVACIVVHHVNKSTGKNDVFPGRGASAIGDWAANILALSPVLDKNGDRTNVIEVRHHKSRNYEPIPTFYLERTTDLLLLPTINPNDAEGFERLRVVYQSLDEMGGVVGSKKTLTDDIAERTGKGRSTAQRMMNEAVQRGIIVFVPGDGRKEGVAIAHNAQKIMGNMES